jgi:murein L,D-transpeptidase YafK
MVPNSAYYLSFNIGYPNAYDRAWGRTGDAIMVHGACSSAGCLSMTDEQVGEIYAIVREAFAGGQREIQMQSLPFHMTAENLAKHRLDPNIAFWQQLKHGADHFDVTGKEPPVSVCGKGYSFALPSAGGRLDPAAPCPVLDEDAAIEAAVKTKESRDLAEVTALVAKGVQPITLVYRDGGQNAAFAARVAEVSRPDALLGAPEEVPVAAGAPRVPGAMPKATLRPAP